MVRVQIPTSLYGASLGKANTWVREQIAFSNPHKPMGDYKLHDDSGKSVSLSAITSGQLDAVNISGVLDTVRINPAHPTDLQGFAHSPAPMFSGNLTRFIPSKVTVSMWESATGEYGSFAGTQFLSRLLTEELKGHNMPDPYVQDLLNARRLHVGDSMEKVRRNPTAGEVKDAVVGLDLGPYQRANTLLKKGKMLGISSTLLDEKVQRYVNDLLDETEEAFAAKKDDDHGAFISAANKFKSRYENSGPLFNDFASNVFAPYLISSSANLYALQYINQYVLPTLRNAIENQKDFSRWYLRKGRREGSGREAALRELDRHYRHIVKSMATAPGDYYYGKELALVANPAFLFKHVGLVLLPLPTSVTASKPSKEDGMRLKRLAALFIQAGNPPEYNTEGGIKVVGVEGFRKVKNDKGDLETDSRKRSPVEYVNRDVFTTNIKESANRKKYLSGFKEVITTLADRVDRREGAYSSHVLVTAANAMAHQSLKDLYPKIDGYPALYYLDLVGIRPIPTNWPEKLIFAMMEVTASYRDRISGLGKDFNFTDFLTPSGIMMTGGSVSYTSENLKDEAEIKDYINKIKESGEDSGSYNEKKWNTNVDATATFLKGVLATAKAVTGKDYNGTNIAKAIVAWESDKTDSGNRQNFHTAIKTNTLTPIFLSAANTSQFGYKDMGDAPSVYKIIGETVKTSISKYGYEPTGDDVKFVTLLLYYCLRNMKLDDEIKRGFIQEMLAEFKDARESTFNEAVTMFEEKLEAAAPAGGGDLSRLVALMAARDLLIESGATEKGGWFGGVRSNPVMAKEDSNLMLKSLNSLIDAEKKRLAEAGGISGATRDDIIAFTKTLFADDIRSTLESDDFTVSTLGSGVDETKENMRELIDKMAININAQVGELITQATEFYPLINNEDEKSRASTLTASLKNLETIVGLYENLGELTSSLTSDFVRGSDAYKEEQEFLFALNAYAVSVKKMFKSLIKDAEKATEKHLEKEDKWGTEFSGYERILVKLMDLSFSVVLAEIKAWEEANDLNVAAGENHYTLTGNWDFTHWNTLSKAFVEWRNANLSKVEPKRLEAYRYYKNIATWAPTEKDENGELLYPKFEDSWVKTVQDGLKKEFRSVLHYNKKSEGFGLLRKKGYATVLAKAMKGRNSPAKVTAYMDTHYNGLMAKVDKELMRLQKGVNKGERREETKTKVQGYLKGVKDRASKLKEQPGALTTLGLGTTGAALGAATLPAFAIAAGAVAAAKGFQGLVNQTQKATNENKAGLKEAIERATARGKGLGEDDAKQLLAEAEAAKNENLVLAQQAIDTIKKAELEREQNRMGTEAEREFLRKQAEVALFEMEGDKRRILADYEKEKEIILANLKGAQDLASEVIEGTIAQISEFDKRRDGTLENFEEVLTYSFIALPENQHDDLRNEAKAMRATMITKLRAEGNKAEAQKFEDFDVEAF